ncbi:RPRM protein, partial [Atractosteus spatula]|nr:RPRM protein [Atractosteus spatula]
MNATEILNRTLAGTQPPGPVGMEALLRCCNFTNSASTNDGFGVSLPDERNLYVMQVVQIAVLCVLSLTVAFGIFFLGCNLLIKSESMINLLAEDRRPSKEAEAIMIGS